MRRAVAAARGAGKTVALVPTMGALHAAHLSLISLARKQADLTVVSIFVNPTQFNSPDDLKNYPRAIEADLEACKAAGVDYVFAPDAGQIYPVERSLDSRTDSGLTTVRAGRLAQGLCGASRPGHFDGVVTIVAILFNVVAPDVAVFGEKDYQQLKVIQALAADLFIPVRIVAAPLMREPDGLAASSRNLRLSAEDRYSALYISRTLFKVREVVANQNLAETAKIEALVRENLEKAPGLRIDYVAVCDRETLAPIERIERPAQLLVAAFCGPVRLIDNIELRIGD